MKTQDTNFNPKMSSEEQAKPKPKDFGYSKKYGWPDKDKLQKYRHAMSLHQKYIYNEKAKLH